MKSIGIEIDKKRAICFVLEKDLQGKYTNLTAKNKYLEIKDDLNNSEIRGFRSAIHHFFDQVNADVIAVITRQAKGRFASSPISFKLEGLIQSYEMINIDFVSPLTLNAFYKKNPMTAPYDDKYQENAARLANYLLNREGAKQV